jgi:hypothetical protein
MGGISLAATRGCRATHILMTAALALVCALLLAFAGSASAAPAADKVFKANPQAGLTEPGGLAVTPDGTVWASDALLGLCRVDVATGTLLEDTFCAPEFAGGHLPDGTELPPPDPQRPAAAFQIAFDSAGCTTSTPPADKTLCNFYVAEGSSGGSGVWRMHWNSDTGVIDAATKIYEDSADQRIMGLALAPGGAVDFAAKRNPEILRIPNAATATLGVGPEFRGVTATGEQASAIANLDGKTYLVEGGQLSVIDVPGHTATLLQDPPAGAVVSSVVADTERNLLFVGTSRSQLTDEVLTLRDGAFLPGAYDHDFANVTTMALAADGGLYIVHDPFAPTSPGVDMPGAAEVFLRAKTDPNPPDVTFVKPPKTVQKSGPVRWDFASTGAAPASFRCSVDKGTPVACDSGSYETDTLTEGAHSLSVRAANGSAPAAADFGVAKQVGLTIDDTKPEIAIDARTAKTAVGGHLRFLFTVSDKTPTAASCRIDGGAPFGCGPGDDIGLALGAHTITVTATDSAGNVSDPVDWKVTAVPAPPVPAAPAPVAATPVTPAAPAAPAASKAAVKPAATREPKIDIDVPCVAVSPSRRDRARYAMTGRRALVSYRAPAKARFAKFTLRRAAGSRREVPIVETVRYTRVRRAGAHRATVALTRTQRRSLRLGRVRLAVAYGTCRTEVGRWQWVSESNTAREGQR